MEDHSASILTLHAALLIFTKFIIFKFLHLHFSAYIKFCMDISVTGYKTFQTTDALHYSLFSNVEHSDF